MGEGHFFFSSSTPSQKEKDVKRVLCCRFSFFFNYAKEFPQEEKSNLLVVNFLGHLFMAVSVNDV